MYFILKGRLKRARVENPKTQTPQCLRAVGWYSGDLSSVSVLAATFTAALMQNRFQKCATLMTPGTLTLRPVHVQSTWAPSGQRRKGTTVLHQLQHTCDALVLHLPQTWSRSCPWILPATLYPCSPSVLYKHPGLEIQLNLTVTSVLWFVEQQRKRSCRFQTALFHGKIQVICCVNAKKK